MKFIAYVKQDVERCDYTIGCGQCTIGFEAESMDAAVKLYRDAALGSQDDENPFVYYGLRDTKDQSIKSVRLYRYDEELLVDIGTIREEQKQIAVAQAKAESEAKERAEFERLKQKYA